MTPSTIALALLVALLLGCGDDVPAPAPDAGPPLFGDAQWQLGDRPAVDVFDYGAHECTVDLDDEMALIALRVAAGDSSIEVRELVTGPGGGSVRGTSCRVVVTSGATEYEGACGGGLLSETQPCQISNVLVDPSAEDGPTVQMSILCGPELGEPLTSPDSALAASLRVLNCAGL